MIANNFGRMILCLKEKHKGFSSCTWGKTEVSLFCHLNYWASV